MKLQGLIAAALLISLVGCQSGGGAAGTGGGGSASGDDIKIGFLVKDPQEPWFQDEWKYAHEAAAEAGFEVLEHPTTSGEEVMTAIDTLKTQGAQGFVICTPEVQLGPAIMAKAEAAGLKVLTVDDRFVDANGNFLDTPYVGISAYDIGKMVGEELYKEMQNRGWNMAETAAMGMTFDEVDTLKQRTTGARDALVEAGFPADKIYFTPQKKTDIPAAQDAANQTMTKHPQVKHWLIFGNNDEAVLGAVRATEGRGFKAADVIGIGINGQASLEDFKRDEPTGVFGSILLSAKKHGYDTAMMMYRWIKDGEEPAKETFTEGIFITRDNWKQIFEEQGLEIK